MEKKLLIGLSLVLAVGFISWSILVDNAQKSELEKFTAQLQESTKRVLSARHAKSNLDQMKTKYQTEKQNLAREQDRFISKDELFDVAKKLKSFAGDYNLKLMDFAPVLDSYFSDMNTGKIITLPINIALHGNYLDIGKFVEDWPELPFYLIADEIEFKRVKENQNLLRADIKVKLYAWNE